MQEPENLKSSLRRRRPGVRLPSASAEDFSPRSDLTYRLIEGVHLSGRSVHFSLFTGSILRNCVFDTVEFTRCDLDGMRVENCRFEKCSFAGAELRSTTFTNCHISDTSFESAHILDCTFYRNGLIDCSLRLANIAQSSFEGGRFSGTTLARSSCTLNKFRMLAFENVTLGDCTFSYNIVKDCRFTDVRLDVECIGLVYGLTRENLSEVHFIYLGEDQFVPRNEDLVDVLMKLYSERKWSVGLMIMRLNYSLTSPAFAIGEYFTNLWDQISGGRLLKTDELAFITDIFQELRAESRLPLLNVVQCLEMTNALADESAEAEGELRTREALVRFSNALVGMLHEMLDEFESVRLHEPEQGNDRDVKVRAVFHTRPALHLSDFLNALAEQSGLPVRSTSRTLHTATGSWIEILHTTLYSVLALQIFLFLLNGCVVQVTELKARWRALASQRLPAHYRGLALSSKQEIPGHLIIPFRQLMKYAEGLPWVSDPQVRGFSPMNFKELQVAEVEEEAGSSSTDLGESQ
jgi:uncharacterized protein YjbI with pentapeptide repeats